LVAVGGWRVAGGVLLSTAPTLSLQQARTLFTVAPQTASLILPVPPYHPNPSSTMLPILLQAVSTVLVGLGLIAVGEADGEGAGTVVGRRRGKKGNTRGM